MRRLAALLAIAAPGWVAACSDRTPVSPLPQAPGAAPAAQLSCVATARARTLTCSDAATGGAFRASIFGGQGTYVGLTSGYVAFDSATGAFIADVALQNLLPFSLGTTNGVDADSGGIKVFFHEGPTTVEGSGAVTVANADGSGAFTAANQPFFAYAAPLAPDAAAKRIWRFQLDPGVTRFAFSVYVQASTPATAFRVLAPLATDTVGGDSVTVRLLGPKPGAVGVRAMLGGVSVTLAYADSGRWAGRLPLAGLSAGTQALRVVARFGVDSTSTLAPFEVRGGPGQPAAVALGSPAGVSDGGVIAVGHQGRVFAWSEARGLERMRPGRQYAATGISPDGRYIVGTASPGATPFRWTVATGAVQLLGPGNSFDVQVNDAGTVAGSLSSTLGYSRERRERAFRWTAARGLEVSPDAVGAIGITAGGAVVGTTSRECPWDHYPPLCFVGTPKLWTSANELYQEQEGSSVTALHPAGYAAGFRCTPGPNDWIANHCRPVRWRIEAASLSAEEWPLPWSAFTDELIWIRAVSASGVVVGEYLPDDGGYSATYVAFRWASPGLPETLPMLGDTEARAYAVNRQGDVAGCTARYLASGYVYRPVVWMADGRVKLLPPLGRDTDGCGRFIDDARTVVGTSGGRVARWPGAFVDALPDAAR